MNSEEPYISRLKECLHYDPESGIFVWRKPANNRVATGAPAGTRLNGYVSIQVDGKRHSAHRLAWLFHYGRWPSQVVDHIDGDKANNRISNLRDVSRSANMNNLHRANVDSKSGVLGVTSHKGRWKAQIGVSGRQIYIGTYDTKEAAHQAYLAAKALHLMLRRMVS